MDFENEIRERLTATEQSVKSAHKRLDTQDKLIESVHSLATKVATLVTEVGGLKGTVDSLVKNVDAVEKEPGEKYKLIIRTFITAVVGALGGYLFSLLVN